MDRTCETIRLPWVAHLSSLVIGPKYQLVGTTKAVFPPFQKFLDTNIIKPIIDREIALTEEEMRDAISYMATHRARGKVIINIDTNMGF